MKGLISFEDNKHYMKIKI